MKCQYHLRNYLDARKHRMRLLTMLWKKVEAQRKKRLKARLLDDLRHEEVSMVMYTSCSLLFC
jgi:hypothetical protein